MKRCVASGFVLAASVAGAHSASDAYLTLAVDAGRAAGRTTLHGQWDIALRDLDFVLKLDDDGDGQVTWGEVKDHLSEIESFAYAALVLDDSTGKQCSIKPVRSMIDAHADGAYAALFFDVDCPSSKSLTLYYKLFFAIDPSHRGIFVLHAGSNISTAVLAPQNAKLALQVK